MLIRQPEDPLQAIVDWLQEPADGKFLSIQNFRYIFTKTVEEIINLS